MVKLFFLLIGFVYLFSAEPSAFGAGDLDSPSPYGLTSSEKVILKNKKEVKTLSANLGFVKSELNDMQEKIDGIRSVVDSQNVRFLKINKKIISLKNSDSNLTKEISEIKYDLNITRNIQEENYKKIKTVLTELSSLIDSINSSYLSKDEFNKEITKIKKMIGERFASYEKKAFKKSILKKNPSKIFKNAKSYFAKKRYNKAYELFKITLNKRYLPATSSFYLGEINFYKKNYPKAIEYYKKSISLYSKSASFTPTLLYHTYISFKKLGGHKKANGFKNMLLKKYPNSKEAIKLQ